MWCPIDQLTVDGYDMQFGTNVIGQSAILSISFEANLFHAGHFFFTELLMPALIEGAKSTPDGHARVVTTSSSGAYGETLHYETLRDGPARKALGTVHLYFQSKFVRITDRNHHRMNAQLMRHLTDRVMQSLHAKLLGGTRTKASSPSHVTLVSLLMCAVMLRGFNVCALHR